VPCFAEPPDESPSTMYISECAGSFSWQSDNFPGRPAISRTPFILVIYLAHLAASLASAASDTLEMMIIACFGFYKRNSLKYLLKIVLTTPSTSDETSFSFVCDENVGSGTFTDIIDISPSFTSSPSRSVGVFLAFSFLINDFKTLVRLPVKPDKWVPPSFWGILLV
jgi:hypothetical protein